MSRSSAAVKLQFPGGWGGLAAGRRHSPPAPCPRSVPVPRPDPRSRWRFWVSWPAVPLAASQFKQTSHFTHTPFFPFFLVICCRLPNPKAGVSPLCWNKTIPFRWILCIGSHGLEQVIPSRHGHTGKLLVFNIHSQTAAGLTR